MYSCEILAKLDYQNQTRMHSSRMCTARSLIISPYLVVSHACPPPEQPHMPPPGATTHAPPPGATMHAPLGPTMHIPPRTNHACPPQNNHACPPPSNHTCPPWEQPCTPPLGSNHARHPPWTDRHL